MLVLPYFQMDMNTIMQHSNGASEIRLPLVDNSISESSKKWELAFDVLTMLVVTTMFVLHAFKDGWIFLTVFLWIAFAVLFVIGAIRRRFVPYIAVSLKGFAFVRSWFVPRKRISDGFRNSGIISIPWKDVKLIVHTNFSLVVFRNEGTHCVVDLKNISFKQDQTTLLEILNFAQEQGVQIIQV